jgi:hypothetical protein
MSVKSIRIERDVDQEPPSFVCGAARVKSIRIEQGIDPEPHVFCTRWFIDRACVQE